jgi:hypothetical protein
VFEKEIEFYIKAGLFEKADATLRIALSTIKSNEKPKLNLQIKEFYKQQAENYEKKNEEAWL